MSDNTETSADKLNHDMESEEESATDTEEEVTDEDQQDASKVEKKKAFAKASGSSSSKPKVKSKMEVRVPTLKKTSIITTQNKLKASASRRGSIGTIAKIREIPPEILSKIFLMVGLESLQSLHSCRQVCREWNNQIRINIWGNPDYRKRMATRIQSNWGPGKIPSSEEISLAKLLGKQTTYKVILRLIILFS